VHESDLNEINGTLDRCEHHWVA